MISTAQDLEVVAESCATVSDLLLDKNPTTQYIYKRITCKGKQGFRFTQRIIIEGREIEVTVKTLF